MERMARLGPFGLSHLRHTHTSDQHIHTDTHTTTHLSTKQIQNTHAQTGRHTKRKVFGKLEDGLVARRLLRQIVGGSLTRSFICGPVLCTPQRTACVECRERERAPATAHQRTKQRWRRVCAYECVCVCVRQHSRTTFVNKEIYVLVYVRSVLRIHN